MFGGSLYASVDPFYMIMLIRNLGSEYIVWDKAATIRFKKPGKSSWARSSALARAPARHAGGPWFEPTPAHMESPRAPSACERDA